MYRTDLLVISVTSFRMHTEKLRLPSIFQILKLEEEVAAGKAFIEKIEDEHDDQLLFNSAHLNQKVRKIFLRLLDYDVYSESIQGYLIVEKGTTLMGAKLFSLIQF